MPAFHFWGECTRKVVSSVNSLLLGENAASPKNTSQNLGVYKPQQPVIISCQD